MKRNNSIELIRIIAMLGVVLTHLITIGGVLFNTDFFSLNYFLVEFIQVWTRIGVPLFIIITGYLMYNKKWKIERLIDIFCQVFFWALLFLVVILIVSPQMLSLDNLIDNFFPYFRGYYWYIIAYTGLFALSPVVNIALSTLDKNIRKEYLIFPFVLFSIIPTFFNTDLFFLNEGRSTLYLILMYSLGNYLKKTNSIERFSKKFFLYFFLTNIALAYLGNLTIAYCAAIFLNKQIFFTTQFFYAYTSPFIIAASVSLFAFIMKLKIEDSKLLYFLSSNSFAVYLIHANPLILNLLIRNNFISLSNKNFFICLFSLMLFSSIIYLIAASLNFIRNILFNKHFSSCSLFIKLQLFKFLNFVFSIKIR